MLTIPARSTVRTSPVEGPRILLVPIDPADGPELWSAVDGSRWHLERWLPWVPYNNSAEASQRYAEACAQDWDAGRAVRLAVRNKADRELLGVVGLDSVVHLHRSCELGYWLKREACGKGLMTEAASACLNFAFDTLHAHRVRCAAATENYASLRVIMRLGLTFEGLARQAEYVGSRWVDHAVFAQISTDRIPKET